MTKILPILFLVATCVAITGWVDAAPPVTGRPLSGVQGTSLGNNATQPERLLAQADAPEKTEAAEPASESAETKATALTALKKARELLANHHSVRANVIETVEIGNHGFTATGRYLQRGETKLRLEFDLQIGETTGALMEVCDGEILYTRHVIGKDTQLTRRNVREIIEAARANGAATADLFIAEMGLGGLPGMLAALEQAMTFDVIKDDTLGDKSVWMIQGIWSPQFRSRWVPPKKADDKQSESQPELPALVPDSVRVYLDRKTGFPMKIEYLKRVPGHNHARPMLTLAFRDVELNGVIDDSEFTFIPPETPIPIDLTPFYKDRIRAAVQAAQQQNRPALPNTPPATTPPQP